MQSIRQSNIPEIIYYPDSTWEITNLPADLRCSIPKEDIEKALVTLQAADIKEVILTIVRES